ncbi:SNF2 family N-terminal domain-containing protein [Trichoderma compactum]
MATPKSPQPPPYTRYPSPPDSCPVPNEAQPELSGLGDPNLKIPENGAAGSQADSMQQGDVVEQSIASILPLAIAEESDISDPPDESSSEEGDDSDYVDERDPSPPEDQGNVDQQADSTLEKKEKIKQPRRKQATNAREYVARLHEEEDRKYAKRLQREGGKKAGANYSRKRKLTGDDTDPRKTFKTANGSVLSIVNDGSSTSDGSSLLPMEPIQATTHAQQFAQLTAAQMKSQIPQNCDTRRKNTQNQDLHEAASLFGYKRVKAVNGRWRLEGMETGLDSYQLTAVAWMVKRELARAKPFGGLQADAPGMGKTVMSLACIVGNQADDEDREKFGNATLVVVPNKTFGKQWEEEAQKHCKTPVKDLVFVYDQHDSNLEDKCKRSFIVIATYSDVLAKYPSNDVLAELEEKYDSDNISFHRQFEAHAGPMFKMKWYRIILDEAHAIKNVNSRTSKACCALSGKYRWALTGTPLANSSEEMYPYLKFTECESTWTLKEFKAMYTTKGKSNAQFEALTSLFMYRRTLDDKFLGHKIINLPEKKEINLDVPLSIEEQVIVEAVRTFYQNAVEKLKQGKLKKDKLEAAVGSLDDVEETENKEKGKKKVKDAQSASCRLGHASQVRKRQAISHSFCIERLLRRSFELEDLKVLMDALEKMQSQQTILEQIRSNIGEDSDMLRYQKGLEILQQREEPMFGKYFDMTALLKLVRAESQLRSSNCLLCNKPPVQPVFADGCGHIFCTKCLSRAAKENHKIDKANFKAGQEGLQGDKKHNCPHKGCDSELEVGEDVETVQIKLDFNAKSYREPGEDYNNVIMRQGDDRNGFFVCSTILEDVPTVPSARLTATMAVALTWLHEAPDDKILIFTQFIGTAKILGYMLHTLGIGFVYYWGGLPDGQKKRALTAIKECPDVKIMVATLKSGGQCLNLTVANRVIIIDPWWNKTAEQQAFGRVTRMGQLKATHLVTLKTEDETDTRIHNLKLKKAEDVDYTLQDDGHTPLDVSEMELQEDILRKKTAMDEKKNKAKARAAKKNATKASSKKRN